jgi:hypothetical protein
MQFAVFRAQKNLTKINHKVSLAAKCFFHLLTMDSGRNAAWRRYARDIGRQLVGATEFLGRGARPVARLELEVSGPGRLVRGRLARGRLGDSRRSRFAGRRIRAAHAHDRLAEGRRRALSLCSFRSALSRRGSLEYASSGRRGMAGRGRGRGGGHREFRAARALLCMACRDHHAACRAAAPRHERAHRGRVSRNDAQLPSDTGRERNGESVRAIPGERRVLERLGERRGAQGRAQAAQGPTIRAAAPHAPVPNTPGVELRPPAPGV